jgi:hypothetical protein
MIEFTIDDARLTARLDKIAPDVRAALKAALAPAAESLAGEARALAAAHIRYLGKKPGQYLASIYGGLFDKGDRIGGFVRSGDPLAHLLEDGASLPARDIFPSAARVLAFDGDAGQVFARVVHFPGATVPPYPAIAPAFESAEGALRDLIERTVRQAAGEA